MQVSLSGQSLTFQMVRRLAVAVIAIFVVLAYLYGPAASPAMRTEAIAQCNDHAEGRLSSTELEQRTGSALAARRYGELDDVLQGLGGLQREVKSHPVRRAVFGVVAFLSSPFVMVGGLFLAFGNDVDDHVFGLVLLVLLLPGLVVLWRWAWPRR